MNPVLSICVPTYNRARYLECMLTEVGAVFAAGSDQKLRMSRISRSLLSPE